MKRALAEPSEAMKREQREKQLQIVHTFREGNFEDLVRRTEPKVSALSCQYIYKIVSIKSVSIHSMILFKIA